MEETKIKHNHAEAFAHMTYRSNDGAELSIWNSRDGVTPFVVEHAGKEFQHVDWHKDRYDPNYQVKEGDLFFRDATDADLRPALKEYVEQMRQHVEETVDPEYCKQVILNREDDYINDEIKECLDRHAPYLDVFTSKQ